MHNFESMCETKVTTMETTDCIIFEAMAEIQMLPVPSKTKNVTFVDMAEQFRDYIIQNSHIYAGISQIHIVFGRYKRTILKSLTYRKRGVSTLGRKIHYNQI